MKNTTKKIEYQGKVYIYYSNKGNVLRTPTGIEWNEKDKPENVKLYEKIEARFNLIRAEYVSTHYEAPSIDYMKEKFNIFKTTKTDINKSISELDIMFNTFLEHKKNDMKEESITIWSWNFKKHLYGFVKEYNINFNNLINEDFLIKWSNFLKSQDYKDTYIKTNISMMKYFILYCKDLKFINKYDISDMLWKKYQSKSKGLIMPVRKYVSLTKDELTFLKSKRGTFKTKRKNRVLDVFLFQCYTSLRYSDVVKINKKSVVDAMLQLKSKKTSSDIFIDLSPILKSILEDNDYNLNYDARNNYNLAIHSIFKKLSKEQTSFADIITYKYYKGGGTEHTISKPKYDFITSHTGRRTFVTMNYENGVDLKDIIKYTGHSKGSPSIFKYISDVEGNLSLSSKMDQDT